MYNIYFNNKSTTDFYLITKDIGRRKRANEQIDQYPVPYRNGDLIIHSNKYNSYTRPMLFTATEPLALPAIYEWLDGSGELRTDLDKGGFFLTSVIGEIDQQPDGPILNELAVEFLVEPFFYLDSGTQKVELTGTTTLINRGTIESEPLITIYGSGDVDFNVNSQIVTVLGIVESITMDTKNLVCYRGNENEGRKMNGEYIRLDKGANAISWTGNITKIEIVPRWCER